MNIGKIPAIAHTAGGYSIAILISAIYFSTALAIIMTGVLALLWLVSGHYKHGFSLLKTQPVAQWSLLLLLCFLLGFSYGEATSSDAFAMLKKYRELLFIPLLIPFLNSERYRHWAWLAFIAASVVTVVGSQLMAIGLFGDHAALSPSFKSRITHSIFIAFFAFFSSHKAFDSQGLMRLLWLALLLLCLNNLFFVVNGRTGQLIFVALALLFAVQRLNRKGLLIAVLAMAVFLGVFLGFSDKAKRIKDGFTSFQVQLTAHPEQSEASMGERFTFWKYSAQLIAEKPVFGQGTGSYVKAYQRISLGKASNNPHNEFLLIGVQLGMVGLFFYVNFLASQYHDGKTLPTQEKWLSQGLLLALVATSLFNSPLLDHTEGHWFTTLIALCFAARNQNA